MKRPILFACAVSLAFASCKPRTEIASSVAADEVGGTGESCPAIDVVRALEGKDRAKALRIMAFLYRMTIRGNSRAAMMFFAAVEGMKFEEYMKAVDATIKRGGLLAANTGSKEIFSDANQTDMDKKVNEDVETAVFKEIMTNAESGTPVKVMETSRSMSLALMAERFGAMAKAEMEAAPNDAKRAEIKAQLTSQFQDMIETVLTMEGYETEATAARLRTRILLDQLNDAANAVGDKSVIDPKTGRRTREYVMGTVVSDAVVTKAHLGALFSMADTMLSGNSKAQINKFEYMVKDFERLAGKAGTEKIFEETGIEKLIEVLKKPGTAEYKRLQSEGKFRLGDKDVTLAEITNPDRIISKLQQSGRGDLLLKAMRESVYDRKAEKGR